MLQRVAIEGIKFPRLYIAENAQDVEMARANGIPYVRWKYGQEQLVRQLLRPALEKMFPGINWNAVLGRKRKVKSEVVICQGNIHEETIDVADHDNDAMLASQDEYDDIVDWLNHDSQEPNEDDEYIREVPVAESRRDCVSDQGGGCYNIDAFTEDRLAIEDYVGDLSSCVDIDALQKLGLLPAFVGDVTDCIKKNLSQSMRWTEGYTKKLGYPLGKFNCKAELPNLLIIDVSASIPDGIAATMLTLADTLRSQCNAELIITSRRSGYYPVGSELPKPQTLRDYYGRSNESAEFFAILEKYVAGREFGHVISFGDNDCPGSITKAYDWHTNRNVSVAMTNTKVHMVHHYHVGGSWIDNDIPTGYAKWVTECCPSADQVFDTSWAKVMKRGTIW